MRLLLLSSRFLSFFRLRYQVPQRNLWLPWLMRTYLLSEAYLPLREVYFFIDVSCTLFIVGSLVSKVDAGQDDALGSSDLSRNEIS